MAVLLRFQSSWTLQHSIGGRNVIRPGLCMGHSYSALENLMQKWKVRHSQVHKGRSHNASPKWWLTAAWNSLQNTPFRLWMKECPTHKLLLGGFILWFSDRVEMLSLAETMNMDNATFQCWRKECHMCRSPQGQFIQCFSGVMACSLRTRNWLAMWHPISCYFPSVCFQSFRTVWERRCFAARLYLQTSWNRMHMLKSCWRRKNQSIWPRSGLWSSQVDWELGVNLKALRLVLPNRSWHLWCKSSSHRADAVMHQDPVTHDAIKGQNKGVQFEVFGGQLMFIVLLGA
jgi:hypothetical protein